MYNCLLRMSPWPSILPHHLYTSTQLVVHLCASLRRLLVLSANSCTSLRKSPQASSPPRKQLYISAQVSAGLYTSPQTVVHLCASLRRPLVLHANDCTSLCRPLYFTANSCTSLRKSPQASSPLRKQLYISAQVSAGL